MVSFGGKVIFRILVQSCILVLLLAPCADSSREPPKSADSQETIRQGSLKLTPQLSFQIKLHAFILWASLSVLMPVGILIIRMSNRVECGKMLKFLFYSHVILQIIAVLLATVGAVLSIKNFENSFNNVHQRIGLALYGFILVQPLIGFFRPHRGIKVRSIWYSVHWLIGTGICIVGIVNIYAGLHAYHDKTSRSVKLWNILFTLQIAVLGFIYLLQDRWDYIKKQGVIIGDDQIRPTDQLTSPSNLKQIAVRDLLN